MKKEYNKIIISLTAVVGIFLVFFFFPNISLAQGGSPIMAGVANFLGATIALIIWLLGKLLVLLIYILIWVAQYNNFITSPAVTMGWTVVRDICNMFFIVILLVIAFATVLNVEKYSWKHLLPKLLIMAVLINFSKLICGVLIDVAQIVMLTFVNGFRDIAGGNFGEMFGIKTLLNISGTSDKVDLPSIAGTYILAMGYVLVALVVIIVILFVLIMRIVMLWLLVVLSPLAYLLKTTPSTEKYAGKWWDQFTSNLVSGPLLAFFIWLSFATMQASSSESLFGPPPNPGSDADYYGQFSGSNANGPAAGLADAGTPQGMLKFIISIGLLIGGLIVTKDLGGMAGSFAGAGVNAISKGGKTLTGFNAVNDRIKAFNKQREAARSEKISNFGAGMYGKYSSVKGGIAGSARSLKAAAGTIPVVGVFTKPIQAIKKAGSAVRNYAQGTPKERDEKRQHRDRLLDAYENGIYTDKYSNKFSEKKLFNGKEIYVNTLKDNNNVEYGYTVATQEHRPQLDANGNELKDKENKTIYQDALLEHRAKKNSKGEIIKDKQGNIEYEDFLVYKDKMIDENGDIAKDLNGKILYKSEGAEEVNMGEAIHKLGKLDYETGRAWTKSMVESRAYNNQREEKKISSEQEKLSKAGLTPAQLLGVLKDSSANDHKKMAAALELAVKQGFKSRDQVKIMQDKLMGHNNTLVSKKFNDEVDKKQAYLNYDLSTADGRQKLMKRDQAGKVEIQQPDAYKDKNFIRAYAESLTDDEFKSKMKRVEAYSSKHADNVKEGFTGYLDEQVPILNKDGDLDKSRKIVKDLTKNMNDVVRGPQVNKDNIKDILVKAFDGMTNADIVKLDPKSFIPDKNIMKEPEERTAYLDALQGIFKNMQSERKHKIATNQNANTKILEALKKFGVVENPGVKKVKPDTSVEDEDEEE